MQLLNVGEFQFNWSLLLQNILLETADEGLAGCSFLEGFLGLEGYIEKIQEGYSSPRMIKKELIELDFSSLLEESKGHSSTSLAAEMLSLLAGSESGTWPLT